MMESSMDAIFVCYPYKPIMVNEPLEMILQNLHRCKLDSIDPSKISPHSSQDGVLADIGSTSSIDCGPEDISIISSKPTTSDQQEQDEFLLKWNNACQAIRNALKRLGSLSLLVKTTDQPSLIIKSLFTEDGMVFRRDIVSLVNSRFLAVHK